ncbi:MAG: bifunctional adenosylcobinamide kinase/adenosylcobinamide-phosphate guanylyltransferase [Planctomycetes bacterium]|nr:bifunctional adenosylcobinamide kinase/adenosylcobinamide-phosphate guanylyltransferase [Planctomycetota bacterium]
MILISGGCRSGKSRYAVEMARQINSPKTVYIATLCFKDAEMDERIKKHKQSRPAEWQTVEEDKNIEQVIINLRGLAEVVIIDCLTVFTSNLMLELQEHKAVIQKAENLLKVIKDSDLTTIMVTNEVGSGIVPDTPLGREFRDLAGGVNQMAAREADEVYLMVAGIPLKVK